MVSRQSKTITETRDFSTEMDRKSKSIRDLTHEGVADVHARSVLIGLSDHMTRQHTAYKQGKAFGSFRNAVSGLFLEDKSATIVVEEDITPETVPAKSWDKGGKNRGKNGGTSGGKGNSLEKDFLEVGHVRGVTSPTSTRKDRAKARQRALENGFRLNGLAMLVSWLCL